MFCSKCGKILGDNAMFCTYCGAAVVKAEQPAPASAPVSAPILDMEQPAPASAPVSAPVLDMEQPAPASTPVSAPAPATQQPAEKCYTFTHIALCLAAVALMAIVAGVFAGLYFSAIA